MIELKHITKTFHGQKALDNIYLKIRKGSVLCLLGPSGCGKTTLLRILAGLEKQDMGDVLCDGRSMGNIPPHKRNFGFMFQDFALFPHKSVIENVMFGLQMKKIRSETAKRKAVEMLELVGLSGFIRKSTETLSGGEKQRVALARSLAPSPRLLMLDEPLGSLDRSLRERLLSDLKIILAKTGTTSVFVTHDQSEAFAIADTVAVMNNGCIMQIDTPENVYTNPSSEFVARFLGHRNIFTGNKHNSGKIRTPIGDFTWNKPGTGKVKLLVKSRGISVLKNQKEMTEESSIILSGYVISSLFKGNTNHITLETANKIRLFFNVPAEVCPVRENQNISICIDLNCISEIGDNT